MNDVRALAQMAKEAKIEGLDKWADGRLEEWLSWLDASGCVLACLKSQEDQTPLGFAVVRPLTSPEKNIHDYQVDEKGQCLYVDMAVAPTSEILKAIGFAVLSRFGQRKWIASQRKGKLHIHDFNVIRKALYRAS